MYLCSEKVHMLIIAVGLFSVLLLPPRRYVFQGKEGIYIGGRFFSAQEQKDGQNVKDYPLHQGRVKVYTIRSKQGMSELVLLDSKKVDTLWK